jgi:hypothetical protein
VASRCASDETCDLALGCLPDPDAVDAGSMDAGSIDGGMPMLDAGAPDGGPPPMDAGGTDAGDTDAGPADAGTDAGPPKVPDAGPPGALGCADLFIGSALGSPVATGSTRSMGNDYNQCTGISSDVAYGWVAPATARYTISTCGSDFDTVLTALDGSCSGSTLRCNDDRCSWQSSITLDLTAGAHVVIVVDGLGETGDYELNVEQM